MALFSWCRLPAPQTRVQLYLFVEVLDVATDVVLLGIVVAENRNSQHYEGNISGVLSSLLIISCTFSFIMCASARREQLNVFHQNDETRRLLSTALSSLTTVAPTSTDLMPPSVEAADDDGVPPPTSSPCYDELRELRADVWAKRSQRYSLCLEDVPMLCFNGWFSFLAPDAGEPSVQAVAALVFSMVSIVYKVWKTASLARTKRRVVELESEIDSLLAARGVGAGRRHSLVLVEENERTGFYKALLGDDILNDDVSGGFHVANTAALMNPCELIREGKHSIKEMRAWHAAGQAFVTKELLPVVSDSQQVQALSIEERGDTSTSTVNVGNAAFERLVAELRRQHNLSSLLNQWSKDAADSAAHKSRSHTLERSFKSRSAKLSSGKALAFSSFKMRGGKSLKVSAANDAAGTQSAANTSERTPSTSPGGPSTSGVKRARRGGSPLRILKEPPSFSDAAALGRLLVAALEDADGTGSAGVRALKARLVSTLAPKKKQRKKWEAELRTKHLQRLALAHVLSARYAALGGLDEARLTAAGRAGLLSKSMLLRVVFYLDSLEAETLEAVWGWDAERSWGVQLCWA